MIIRAEDLGAASFRRDHQVRFAYAAGAMYKGIASKELVIRMARARMLAYLGTGGLRLDRMESDIDAIEEQIPPGASYGMNLLNSPGAPDFEEATVDLFLRRGVTRVEAAAYTQISPALVRYRARGLTRESGQIRAAHRVLAKVSRPEVAQQFLDPAPDRILRALAAAGRINPTQAELASLVPMADDICVEADSGGHTDQGVAAVLVPAMVQMRDSVERRRAVPFNIRVGAAGGLGTPAAVAAAFVLGADFVVTGSVNQCTVEAGNSDAVKDMLQQAEIQDTAIAPAGDMFEQGAKVRVLKKGLFFPARASKLFDLYRQYESLDDIDPKTREQIETKYFKRTFREVYEETKAYYLRVNPEEIERAERNPKHKMALIFKWYFIHSARLARMGAADQRVDYQIHCGPAMGAFNQWVKGAACENWRRRHVDEIAEMLMSGAAETLAAQFRKLCAPSAQPYREASST
jgi:trans-AT polyketide synthase/acyltransferase/oxidoreductase domain-containing protein